MHIPFAKGTDRVVAYAIDVGTCGMFLLLLVSIFEGYCDSKAAGAALFACIVFLYQMFFLIYRNGLTFGKYARNIAPISSNGMPLRTRQIVVRAALISLPYFLIGAERSLPHGQEIFSATTRALSPVVGVAFLFVELYVLEFHKQPRTMTDRISGIIVINLPPPQPHRAPAFPMYSRNDAEFGVKPSDEEPKSKYSPMSNSIASAPAPSLTGALARPL